MAQLGPLNRELRQWLDSSFDSVEVFASPMTRALVTARAVMGEGRALHVDANLMEFDYGDYEGLTTEQIREQRPEWDMWRDGCSNGETAEDVGRRVDAFLGALREGPDSVVLFAHAHVLRILAARAVGLEARDGEVFSLDPATVSVIGDVRSKWVIQHWNVTSRPL